MTLIHKAKVARVLADLWEEIEPWESHKTSLSIDEGLRTVKEVARRLGMPPELDQLRLLGELGQ